MFEIRDDEIDVETIMARIRDKLRARASGGADAGDQGLGHLAVPASSPTSTVSTNLRHHLHSLRLVQDPRPQGPIASHGSKLIEQSKRFIRRVLAPYHRAIFARQAEFNATLVGLMSELLQTLEKTNADRSATLAEVQSRLESFQAEQAKQCAEQAETLASLASRVAALQAAHATLEARAAEQVETLASRLGRLEARDGEHERTAADLQRQIVEVTNRLLSHHRASEELAARHVDLGRRFEEQRQDMILQKRRLDLILAELRKKIEGEKESLAKVAAQKDRLMDHSYFLFENRHRGSLEEIKKRQEVYLPIFKERFTPSGGTNAVTPSIVLDVGCGRGEFLELLREHGVPAKGIDSNEDMVHFCQGRGLDVEHANALAYLQSQPDDSLGGIIACQVIEHLHLEDLIEFIKLCHQKLERGGRAVFETVNPLSLLVSATNFYLDLSHVRQVHPVALQFLAEAVGFTNTELKFLAPYPDEMKLQLLNNNNPDFLKLNQNFARLNEIVFGYQDYALICSK